MIPPSPSKSARAAAAKHCAAKRAYHSKAKAEESRIRQEQRNGLKLYPYECNVCSLWHLSKSPTSATETEERHIWRDSLYLLGKTLRQEGERRPGTWAWRQLARGALVAYNTAAVEEQHGRRVTGECIRIARRGLPTSAKAKAAWGREVAIFIRDLNAMDWVIVTVEDPEVIRTYCWNPAHLVEAL